MVRIGSILKRALFPTRVDFLAFVVAILLGFGFATAYCLNSIGSAIGIPFALCFAACVIASLIAIGSVFALGRHSVKRSRLLALGCTVAIVGTLLVDFYATSSRYFPKLSTYQQSDLQGVFDAEKRFQLILWILGLIAVPFVSWCLFATVRWFPIWISKLKGSDFKMTRKKLLIGIAGVLLVIGVGNNVLNETMTGYDNDAAGWLLGSLLTLTMALGFVLVIYFPVFFLSGNSARWKKGLFVLSVVAVMIGFIVWTVSQIRFGGGNEDFLVNLVASFFGFCVFLASLAGICNSRKVSIGSDPEFVEEGDVNERSPEAISKLSPSLWSCLAIVLLVLSVAFPFCFELNLLATQGFSGAHDAAKVRWNSGGQIANSNARGFSVYRCRFDDSTDPNILEVLDVIPSSILQIDKSSKQVDFAKLERQGSPLGIAIDDGQITSKQLGDLLSQPAARLLFNGCEVINPDHSVEPDQVENLCFQSMRNRVTSIRNGLGAFKTFENVRSVTLYTRIVLEDWPEVVRASETTTVTLSSLPDGLTPAQMKQANANIVIQTPFVSADIGIANEEQRAWLLSSHATMLLSTKQKDLKPFFDFMFAFPKRFKPVFHGINWRLFDLNNRFERSHFVFESEEDEKITGIFLPFGEGNRQVSALTELKVLSFDENWIQQKPQYESFRQLVDLSGLVNLEGLYLSSSTEVESLDFLVGTTALKHLQIPTVNRSLQTAIGFDDCPTLESITSLGLPDVISLTEFTRLPNFKRLVVVDRYAEVCYDETMKSEYLAKLKKKFPSAEIQLVDERGFSPKLPQAFVEHRDRLAKQLSEELLRTDKGKE